MANISSATTFCNPVLCDKHCLHVCECNPSFGLSPKLSLLQSNIAFCEGFKFSQNALSCIIVTYCSLDTHLQT